MPISNGLLKQKIYFVTTGLYFAVLQLGYFLMLQLNVSSTYVTYMAVVLAWMTGTVTGLWWDKPGGMRFGIAGLVAYYAVYGLVSLIPFSLWVLPWAMFGVFVTGLWAGQFFVRYFHKLPKTDVLFFYENNGFILGLLITFIGFVYLGNAFIRFAPLLLGCLLVIEQQLLTKAQA